MTTLEIISGRDNYVGLSFVFFGGGGVGQTVCFNNFTAILD